MEETLYTLLTDVDARSTDAVDQRLAEQVSLGAPWFD